MAEINIFHYIPKKTIIHAMDGRIKLVCMILFAVAAGSADDPLELIVLSLVLLMAYRVAGLSFKNLLNEIRYFYLLISIIILVHSLTVPGTPIDGIPIHGVTWEGLNSGLYFGWQLILMILLSIIMTGTTPLSLFKNVIEWFLRPVPLISETRVATMFSLTFVLIPLIFDQASEMVEAQKSRCIDERKNPVGRMVFLIRPLLLHTLMRAEEMVLAMESRCYSEVRTPMLFKTAWYDWLILCFSASICVMILGGFLLR